MAFDSLDSVQYPNLTNSANVSAFRPVRKSKAKWFVGLLSLFLLAGGSYLAYQKLAQAKPAKQPMAAVPVGRSNLSVTVSANGTIEPEQLVNVSPKTSGILKTLMVEEGDFVKQGQAIAQMDDSNLRGQLTEAKGKLAAAEANLEKVIAGNRAEEIAQTEARLNSVQANLKQAEDDLNRNRELMEAGAISQQAYNKFRTARDTAQAEVTEAQEALALSKAGSRQEDIDAAQAQVETAKGVLETIQTQINDTVIRAPFTGMINRVYADPGAFVTPMTSGSSVSSATSSSILSLASTNQVAANVSENSIAKIRVGQPVLIEADAYPGKKFQGRVKQIATEATVEQNVTSFEVEVSLLPDAEKLLRSGMNVSVEFQAGQVKNAITVPTIAIVHQDNQTGVFVSNGEQEPPRFIPITTGATVNNQTEVKSGLQGTEKVLISPPPKPQSATGISFPGLPGSTSMENAPPGGSPGGPPDGSPGGPRPDGPPPQ